MNGKQRFFDVVFNNEPCFGSSCINNCNATEVTKHQLFDAANSNIPNKNVLNTAEATAASNIPSKISGEMFLSTSILQYVKDKYENLNSSHRKEPATNICDTYATSGIGNVGYGRIRGLVIRNTVIPWSETFVIMKLNHYSIKFCGHVFHMICKSYLIFYAGESVKIKPGPLVVDILHKTTTQKYYFPGMVNLVREFVACCLEGQSMQRKTDGSGVQDTIGNRNKIPWEIGTMVRMVRMFIDIEMSVSEVCFRNIYHARSVIRLTIYFTIRNGKGW